MGPVCRVQKKTCCRNFGTSSSRKEYQNAIIGQNCEGTADYTVGTSDSQIATQPGQGNGDIPRTTVQAVELNLPGNQGNGGVQTCRAQIGNDATCYDPIIARAIDAGILATRIPRSLARDLKPLVDAITETRR